MTARSPAADQAETVQTVEGTPAPSTPSAATSPDRKLHAGGSAERYLVIEEIARGGMGVVLRAYDTRLQRELALKSVRADALSVEAHAQLLREAQAMAQLSHPNVVPVYDVELDGDNVVLAMEYVRGSTLKDWLERNAAGGARTWRRVLEMFVAAGQGLAAAHRVGLLHRDFKPANVLVGDDGRVRVTDFGLARPHAGHSVSMPTISESSTDFASRGFTSPLPKFTEDSVIAGTPGYMAPEQHDGTELGPATDQYAYCVALWEGLTGQRPFSASHHDVLAAMKRTGPPSWPTDALVPKPIVAAIRRGLEPNARDRWSSVEALLDALSYDPRSRQRKLAAGVSACAALGGLSLFASAWQQRAAEACSGARAQIASVWNEDVRAKVETAMLATQIAYATDTAAAVGPQLDLYASAWAAMHTAACEATTVRREQTETVLDLRMSCLHRAKVDLDAVADLLTRADAQVVQRAHQLVATLPMLERCADLDALTAEVEPPGVDEAAAVEASRVRLAQAKALRGAGKFAEARERLLALHEDAKALAYGPLQTEVVLELGLAHENQGDYGDAVKALQEAFASGLKWKQWPQAQMAASRLVHTVGSLQARPREGMAYAETARGLLPHGDSLAAANLHRMIGSILHDQARFAEAEVEYRKALNLLEAQLGPDDLQVSMLRVSLAGALNGLARHDEAQRCYQGAWAVQSERLGREHPQTAYTQMNLGLVYHAQGRYEEAEVEIGAALQAWERVLGPEHVEVALARTNYAEVLGVLRRFDEAETQARAAIAIWKQSLGPDHPYVGLGILNLSNILLLQERYSEGEKQLREGMELWNRIGPDLPNAIVTRQSLGDVLAQQGRYEEAEVEYRAVVAAFSALLGAEHFHSASAAGRLASVLRAQGRLHAAEQLYRTAFEAVRALPPDNPVVVDLRAGLVQTLVTRGKTAEAALLDPIEQHSSRATSASRR